MNMTLSLEDKKNKIIKEANGSGKEKVWQKVGWIFLLLLIAMLRMAQIKHNPPDFRCWFNESSKICSNATPDMYAVESFRLLANEGASPISVITQTLPTIRASIRASEGDNNSSTQIQMSTDNNAANKQNILANWHEYLKKGIELHGFSEPIADPSVFIKGKNTTLLHANAIANT